MLRGSLPKFWVKFNYPQTAAMENYFINIIFPNITITLRNIYTSNIISINIVVILLN